jgi:hypothetical protein
MDEKIFIEQIKFWSFIFLIYYPTLEFFENIIDLEINILEIEYKKIYESYIDKKDSLKPIEEDSVLFEEILVEKKEITKTTVKYIIKKE